MVAEANGARSLNIRGLEVSMDLAQMLRPKRNNLALLTNHDLSYRVTCARLIF